MLWCRPGEWVFTTKWRIYQGIWERNILPVGTLKAFFTACFLFHCVGATGQVLPGAALQIGTCLCASDLKEVVRKGGQGNLISLCLFLQPSAKLAFLGNWALMPGVWERLEAPHDSGEWFAVWRWLSRCWAVGRSGTRRGRETHTSSPDRPVHLYTIHRTHSYYLIYS